MGLAPRLRYALLGLAIAIGTALRCWYVFESVGTNDVRTWFGFLAALRQHGLGPIYEVVNPDSHPLTFFNHPPLMAMYLLAIEPLVSADIERFPMLLRLPATLSDIGSALCVFGIASTYRSPKLALWSAALVALTPALIWISGFHGNTDPVFVFLILLAVYLLGCKRRVVLAGIALGLALNIKIVPVITLPVFFTALPDRRARLRFFGSLGAVVLAGYGYHLLFWFDSLWQNVFCYKSWPGFWGFSQLAADKWSDGLGTASKLLIAGLIGGKSLWALAKVPAQERTTPRALGSAVAWSFLIFLIFMPGFGVQYLAWFAAPVVLLSLPGAIVYNALASFFLFGVYSFWANGTTIWVFAQARAWPPFWMNVGLALWASLIGLALYLSVSAARPAPAPEADPRP